MVCTAMRHPFEIQTTIISQFVFFEEIYADTLLNIQISPGGQKAGEQVLEIERLLIF